MNLSNREVAAMFGVPPWTTRRWANRGLIPFTGRTKRGDLQFDARTIRGLVQARNAARVAVSRMAGRG